MMFDRIYKNQKLSSMKRSITLTAVSVILAITFHCCFTPQNVVRLQPENKGGTWLNGQQFISDSINGIIYEVGFDQMIENRYWFDFTITNLSNLPVLIDPIDFYIQAFDGRRQPLSDNKIPAVNPENEILEIEKLISKNKAQGLNQMGVVLLAATIDVATGIAAVSDDDPHNDHLRTHLTHDALVVASDDQYVVQSLDNVKETWKNTTIRKTTLNSNYNMKGKVFFPAFRDAVYIKLYLPVDDEFLEMGFMQLQFPVH
jgi:hypothetical protein